MDVVLIPAYEPDDVLVELASRLKREGFEVLVVNDGSGPDYETVFDRVREYATVLSHEYNRGKGAALKTGMYYIRYSMPECEHFITCDADGQHRVEDVIRVRDCLHGGQKFVLTVRVPTKESRVPIRSRFGNSLSRFVYTLLTNRYLSDNQSGLRGFNRIHLDWLIDVGKDNYDYEMNVLYYASKKNIYIATLPIEAVYIDGNSSSHFNPFLDTLRIYRSLFSLAGGTVIAFLVAEILVLITTIFLGYDNLHLTIPGVGAITCLVTFVLNKHVFFRKTPCYDYWVMLIYTVMIYFMYTMMCQLFMYITSGYMPLIIAFNCAFINCLPLRYFMHKFIFIASRHKE